MYFKSVEIENIGPIDQLKIEFPKDGDKPKPIIIVGENGTGKSILLSHLVNTLIIGKQSIYDDSEVDSGKAYKYRSPHYIKSGKDFFYSSVKFDSDLELQECQLKCSKEDFEKNLNYVPARKIWINIPEKDSSFIESNFANDQAATKEIFGKQCCLFFPTNRFEDPAWLNVDNLKSKPQYSELKHISRYSNRSIVNISPLKVNRDWLLDVIFDRQAFELNTHNIPFAPAPNLTPTTISVFGGFSGQSTNIYNSVLSILKIILKESGNIRLGAGTRQNRQIAIMKDEQSWVPNLFQLSTGETELLNLFLSILRDFDLSEGSMQTLSDVKGIVIIDEIDAHLHTSHQKEVLPELIASFPNVQFIITTHSPLFLMGMDEKFGSDNFVIVSMPEGEKVISSDFSEFNEAYEAFKQTKKHRAEIRRELELNSKPVVFFEGDYDIRYLVKAAELLNKQDLLASVQIKDAGGFGNLDKVWKAFSNPIAEVVPNKIILIYDCDTNKQESDSGFVYKRVMPSIDHNPIKTGIENLFSKKTIAKLEATNPEFIDVVDASSKRVRNQVVAVEEIKSVNKDEKGRMCDWLCLKGTQDDFSCFDGVFKIIEDLI